MDEEVPSHEGGLGSIDILLHGHGKTCIQVEGPTHYTLNTHEYVGRTRARDTVLRHHGWRVIQVRARDCPVTSAACMLDLDWNAMNVGGGVPSESHQEEARGSTHASITRADVQPRSPWCSAKFEIGLSS